jgi:DSF synthase
MSFIEASRVVRQSIITEKSGYPELIQMPGSLGQGEFGKEKLEGGDGPCVADVDRVTFATRLKELELSFDRASKTLWQYMTPIDRPSFTPDLLRDMTTALDMVEAAFADWQAHDEPPVSFLVLASKMPGIFNLGGDLRLFLRLIEERDRDGLLWYARICANGQYRRAVSLDLPICTIALVQGDALGGGFEAALAHQVIIAERSAKFGLPEVLFDLFPGMGAYSFLSRRLDAVRAERMILSGRVYTADELHEMGVVDVVADDGEGVDAVYEYIRQYQRNPRSRQAVLKARSIVQPVTRQELVDVADLWVETALTLRPSDLRRMKHLVIAQDRRWSKVRAA